jgi:dTDP-4-dehydrorhamnose 3,5-epimerase
MLRANDPHFINFGEIYFSTIKKNVVKAWHLHKEMTLNYACVSGEILVALYDGREGSPTEGAVETYVLNSNSLYFLLTIPPYVWNGFRIPTDRDYEEAIVANCATLPHDPDEIIRVSPEKAKFPFDWGPYEVGG